VCSRICFGPSSHGVGTPIDFNRACARPARAFIPARYAQIVARQVQHLAPELPIFLDLRSVSADPRASLPWVLHAAAIRRTAAFEGRVLKVEVNPKLRAQVGMPIRDHVDPFDRR
jgi:hypothetical protein